MKIKKATNIFIITGILLTGLVTGILSGGKVIKAQFKSQNMLYSRRADLSLVLILSLTGLFTTVILGLAVIKIR